MSVGEYADLFSMYIDEGYDVLHIGLGSSLSVTNRSATLEAQDFDGRVEGIDSCNLSTGTGLIVIKAAELIAQGKELKAIAEELRGLVSKSHASFVIDKLNYLAAGGRCTAIEAFGANLLGLKPCIEVKNGSMGVGKKYRGVYGTVLKQYAQERLQNLDDIDTSRVFVTHAGCDAQIVEDIVNQVKETGLFKEVFVTRAGCTISSHCGANTLGVLFIRKSPIA